LAGSEATRIVVDWLIIVLKQLVLEQPVLQQLSPREPQR
jgi:hypothetical protein